MLNDIRSFRNSIYYLIINCSAIKNYNLNIYELSNFEHVLSVVSQTRVLVGSRTHDLYANSLAHYPLDYHGTQVKGL